MRKRRSAAAGTDPSRRRSRDARQEKPAPRSDPGAGRTPLTFDVMARAYLEDYLLQRCHSINTARSRVEHLREFFGGWPAETITADAVRRYQLHRRKARAEAATINRGTSALSRMFQLAIRRGQESVRPVRG